MCRLLLLSKSELETCSFGLNARRTVGSVVVALVVVECLGFEVLEFLCLFFLYKNNLQNKQYNLKIKEI